MKPEVLHFTRFKTIQTAVTADAYLFRTILMVCENPLVRIRQK
jgi:hypothetical protein